jgi:hypothetical protein
MKLCYWLLLVVIVSCGGCAARSPRISTLPIASPTNVASTPSSPSVHPTETPTIEAPPIDMNTAPGLSPGFSLAQEDAYMQHIKRLLSDFDSMSTEIKSVNDIAEDRATVEKMQQEHMLAVPVPTCFVKMDSLLSTGFSGMHIGLDGAGPKCE